MEFGLGGEVGFDGCCCVNDRVWLSVVCIGVFNGLLFRCSAYIQHFYFAPQKRKNTFIL